MNSLLMNATFKMQMFKWPEVFRWSNYADAIEKAGILRAVVNSMFVSLISTVFIIVIGMFAGYVLARKKFRFRGIVYSIFLIGVMVPVHCTIIPISGMATAVNGKNSFWFLILVYIAFNLSQAIFLFSGYLQGIDKELDEAAIIDGCNDFQLLTKILFPVSAPIISTEAILAFVYGYSELIFAMILMTDASKYTVSRAMLTFQGGYNVNLGPIFACIIITIVPMVVLYIAFHEKVQDGMLTGAVKG